MSHHQVVTELFKRRWEPEASISGIEIGTGGGDLTTTLLLNFPNLVLVTIDPWKHVDGVEFEASWPQEALDNAQRIARERLKEYAGRIVILAMPSKEALEWCPDYVDFVWIDGDHSAEAVTFDIENYLPLIRPGGIIGGHDFGQVHPLTEIIHKKFGDRLNSGNDFTWWVYV